MINMKKRVLTILISLLLVLTGCSVKRSEDRNIVSNYEEAINQSELIVIGHFEGYKESWNMARNIEDSLKESEEYYVEGKIYSFVVDEVLKGSFATEKIEVNQRFSDNYSGKVKLDEYYVDVDYSQEYVLFLAYNELFEHYFGSFSPFIYTLNDSTVSPCVNNGQTENTVSSIDVNDLRVLMD